MLEITRCLFYGISSQSAWGDWGRSCTLRIACSHASIRIVYFCNMMRNF